MFRNLLAEMARIGLTQDHMATDMGIMQKTMCYKMSGKANFNINEMNFIKRKYFPNMTLDYLFENKEVE